MANQPKANHYHCCCRDVDVPNKKQAGDETEPGGNRARATATKNRTPTADARRGLSCANLNASSVDYVDKKHGAHVSHAVPKLTWALLPFASARLRSTQNGQSHMRGHLPPLHTQSLSSLPPTAQASVYVASSSCCSSFRAPSAHSSTVHAAGREVRGRKTLTLCELNCHIRTTSETACKLLYFGPLSHTQHEKWAHVVGKRVRLYAGYRWREGKNSMYYCCGELSPVTSLRNTTSKTLWGTALGECYANMYPSNDAH